MDTGIITIISTAITTIGLIVVARINIKGNTKVSKLETKVGEYHKEVNGKMSQLLEVTGDAKKAEGKEEARQEAKDNEKS